MVNGNYERILEKISKLSGLTIGVIEDKIDSKRSNLSGLISKEGAALLVAKEEGISFDSETLKVDELLPGMRNVNVIGKVFNMFPVRKFTTKRGDESKVVNFFIADETSNIKVVLWDTNHIELIEKGEIAENSVVCINNATMRDSELHLGSFSNIKLSEKKIDNIITDKIINEKNISKFNKGESVGTRAFIVQSFEPRFFNVCSECKGKVEQNSDFFICAKHEKVVPEKRAVLTIVIDDGTDSIRAVLFHEIIEKLGFNFSDLDSFSEKKKLILGKEMLFSGNVRENSFFNNLELVVDNIKQLDIDQIIKKLEKNN